MRNSQTNESDDARAAVETSYGSILDEMGFPEYTEAERALLSDVNYYYGRFVDPRTREYALESASTNVGRAITYLNVTRPGLRLLDVGSGLGMQSLIFARLGATVVGVDLDPRCVTLAEKRRRFLERKWGRELRVTFVASDFRDFARSWQPRDFDAAFSMSAFAHIPPVEETVGLISGLLRPESRIYLWDLNPDFLYSNVWAPGWTPVPRPGHVRRILEQHGFRVEGYMGGGAIPRMLWRWRRTNGLLKRANRLLRHSVRLSFNYVIAAHRSAHGGSRA